MSGRRAGVVILDFGRPDDAARAAASARAGDAAARVLVVENAARPGAPDPDRLRLPENRGFGGGTNAGLRQLLAEGCDPLLILNNDAVLEPGALEQLAGALQDETLAAVGPVILREADGRVESRGIRFDRRLARVRLLGQGEAPPPPGAGLAPVAALSGAALMMSRHALERVGPLDEDYFFSFEDVDWCARARGAGFGLRVVLDARARHGGSRTIGRASPDRFYYAARNHVRFLERRRAAGNGGGLALVLAAGWNLAHALVQAECPRAHALRAVVEGIGDARRGRFGPRAALERA